MSNFILSCRHEVTDIDHSYQIMTKEVDRYGEKAIGYRTVCGSCEDSYRQRGEIFDTEEDAFAWIRQESW